MMKLVSSKCLTVLLYATEAGPFSSRDQSSISFAMTRVLMKIFNTGSRDIIEQCQLMFGMLLVAVFADQVLMRKVRFLVRFTHSENAHYLSAMLRMKLHLFAKKYSANETNIYACIKRLWT